MVAYTVLTASLFAALAVAAPAAQVTAPVNNPDGSQAGVVGLSNPGAGPQLLPSPPGYPPAQDGPGFPPQGENEEGEEEFPAPPQGAPGFPPPPPGFPAPPSGEEYEEGTISGRPCPPRVWFQPWTWFTGCNTSGSGEVETTIETD